MNALLETKKINSKWLGSQYSKQYFICLYFRDKAPKFTQFGPDGTGHTHLNILFILTITNAALSPAILAGVVFFFLIVSNLTLCRLLLWEQFGNEVCHVKETVMAESNPNMGILIKKHLAVTPVFCVRVNRMPIMKSVSDVGNLNNGVSHHDGIKGELNQTH